jgi:putative tryptophan/tyrosine transport system substrate-binding protein
VRRREVVAGLGATAAWPLATRAQPALPRVGFLSGRSAAETVSVLAAFHRGLAEAGFVEGKNIAVDYRWAEGHYQGLPALAAELVMRGPAVLAATAAVARRLLQRPQRQRSRSCSRSVAIR